MHDAILIDSGPLVAFYNQSDRYHDRVCAFFDQHHARLVTTSPCLTEVMWLLSADWRVQNEFIGDLASGLYEVPALRHKDFARIAELNRQYASIPADITALSLIAISERLDIPAIASFDRGFAHFRRYQYQPFIQLLAADPASAARRLKV